MNSKSTINGYRGGVYKELTDKIGALSKNTKLRRIEPYADIIEEVLAKYNTDDNKRTMMIKRIRKPVEGTTDRKKHTENVRYIAGKIADNFDWLNSDITRIIAKEHDTGHTFLGHSGEWWISSINDTYGLPNYVHNATGTRKLVYRQKVYDEIETEIRKKYPDISSRKLRKIKRDLWLIMDGINCHNGEKSEYSYAPDFSKSEKRFEDELMGCYVKKGFDRSLVPATAEGSLMRLCDKISYIPFDMVDIFRNHLDIQEGQINGVNHEYYKEYSQKLKAIGMPEGSLERLKSCKTEKEYDDFAFEIQEYFIQDVIKNTKRNNIRMSQEMTNAMHAIRDINNEVMVNYTVMKEDHEAYVPAIENLINNYSILLIDNNIINRDNVSDSLINKFSSNKKFANEFEKVFKGNPIYNGFAKFVVSTNPEDFEFTIESVRRSLEQTIDDELEVAESVAMGRISRDNIKAVGNKSERINTYINAFMESLDKAYDENLFQEFSKKPINIFKKNVWLKKTRERIKREALSLNPNIENSAGTIPFYQMVAMDIAAQYISTLNDEQFFELIQNADLITEKQAQSLQRSYNSFDFRSEHQKHSDWDNIAKLQRAGTAER